MMEKTLLTIDIFKYERRKNVDCDQQHAHCTDIAVWAICLSYLNMATVRWKWNSESYSWRDCTKYDRTIIVTAMQAAENEDQIHSCPMREKKDVRVLSLAWMMPRWKPARAGLLRNFDTRDLDWVMRKMHIIHLWVRRRWQSERTWRSWSITGIIRSSFRLWITGAIRPRGLECKVYTKRIPSELNTWSWLEVRTLAATASCGSSPKLMSTLRLFPKDCPAWPAI